ncbi:hypothetical protein PSHT_10261 [Puccinia striiformis]|uniref:Uncharacterized protein n=1 Tax=Puccinia striiformis TaxID=27350 RepID=A0A2S4VAY6_9BASI|nr:hypothetical protein PSHT_10261 [Puccinia striiformis]
MPVYDHSHQTEVISSFEIGSAGAPRSFRRPAPASAPRRFNNSEFKTCELVDTKMSFASKELTQGIKIKGLETMLVLPISQHSTRISEGPRGTPSHRITEGLKTYQWGLRIFF